VIVIGFVLAPVWTLVGFSLVAAALFSLS